MKRHLVNVIVAVSLLWSAVALAGHWSVPTGEPTLTSVSGSKGKTHATMSSASNKGIAGFSWVERGDKACQISARYSFHFTSGIADGEHEFKEHGCSGVGKSSHFIEVAKPETEWVHAVQVCLNKKGTRLKGIRLWPTNFTKGGTMTRSSKSREKKLANCNQWKKKVQCSSGQVARGVQVHYTEDNGYKGIALKCSKIEYFQATLK